MCEGQRKDAEESSELPEPMKMFLLRLISCDDTTRLTHLFSYMYIFLILNWRVATRGVGFEKNLRCTLQYCDDVKTQ